MAPRPTITRDGDTGRASEASALRGWNVRERHTIPAGDAGTLGHTVPWIRRLVREGRSDPVVQARARQLVERQRDPVGVLFRYVRSLPYRTDQALAKRHRLGDLRSREPVQEVLQTARGQILRGLRHGDAAIEGDCDCRCVLFQSLAESLGYPTRICIMRGPGRSDFSHVFPEVLVNGRWLCADTIMNGLEGRPFFELGDRLPPRAARDVTRFPVG